MKLRKSLEEFETFWVNTDCHIRKLTLLTLFSEGDTNSKADKPVALISRSNWNLDRWLLWREENRRIRRKSLGLGTRTNYKLNPHETPGPGHSSGRRALSPLRVSLSFCAGGHWGFSAGHFKFFLWKKVWREDENSQANWWLKLIHSRTICPVPGP